MGTVPFLLPPENMFPIKRKNLNPGVPRPLDNKGTFPSTKVKALPPENTNFFNNALNTTEIVRPHRWTFKKKHPSKLSFAPQIPRRKIPGSFAEHMGFAFCTLISLH